MTKEEIKQEYVRLNLTEGDDYWVVENGMIVRSVYDHVTEEMIETGTAGWPYGSLIEAELTTMTHTQGPWNVSEDTSPFISDGHEIYSSSGNTVAHVEPWNESDPESEAHLEALSNARLIAAAPTMVQQLLEIKVLLYELLTGEWDISDEREFINGLKLHIDSINKTLLLTKKPL